MKKTLIGLVAASLCAVSAFATVTITAPSITVTADTAENASGGGSFTALGNVVIAEGADTDFATQTSTTLILPVPAGWRFNNNALTASFQNGRNGGAVSAVATSNAITVTLTVSGVNKTDTLTISGIQVKPLNGTNLITSTIVRPTGSSGGTSVILGTTNSVFGTLKQVAGAPKQFVFQTTPSSTATAGTAFAQQPVLLVKDQFGTTRSLAAGGVADNSTSVTAARTTGIGAGTLQGTVTKTAADGVVTYNNLAHNVATNISITFTAGPGTNITSGTIAVSPATASALTFSTSPNSAVAGSPFGVQPSVKTQDAFGNDSTVGLASQLDVTVSLTNSTGTLLGTQTLDIGTAAGNGSVTYSGLQLNSAGTKLLSANASGFTAGTSSSFNVAPAAAAALAIQTQPSTTATAGSAFATQPVIRIEDQYGNTVTNDNSTQVTVSAVGGSASLQGTTTATAVNGIVTFSGLNYQVAETISLSFASVSLTGATSDSVAVSPAAAASLAFTTSPGLSTAGAAFPVQPVVITKDAFGNNSSVGLGASKTVTVSLTSGSGTLLGTATADIGSAVGNGSVTFTDLEVDIAGSGKQLTASASGLADGLSSTFAVQPSTASKLTVQTEPSSSATAGVAFAQQPVLRVEDAFGNLVDTDSSTVVYASRNLGAGILQGTTNATAQAGIVTFVDLAHTVATTINLDFAASGLTGATSANINVGPAAASQLAFTIQPGNASAGLPFGVQPVVKTKDQYGNDSAVGLADSQVIELSGNIHPLVGTTNVDLGALAGNGVAAFTNIQIDVVSSGNQLTASSAGFSSVQSDAFNVLGADQTITFDAITNKVYGDEPFNVSATASSALPVSYSILSGPATNNGDLVTILGAGEVVIRGVQAGDAIYNATTNDYSFNVAPATLGVAAVDKSRLYGQGNPTLTYTVSGFVNSDSEAILSGSPSLSTAGTNVGIGVYPITIAAGSLAAENYVFSFTNGSLTVNPASLTATAENKSRAYGQANPTFTAAYSGFVNGDDESVVSGTLVGVTSADTNSPVGTYSISISGVTATNYSITFVDGNLSVTPFALVAVADSATNIYGSTNTVFTGTLNGVQNGDDITATFETTNVTAASPVGSYDIVPVLHDSGSKLTNYTVSTTNGILTIAKATLTVTANDQSRTYGGANVGLTVNYSGFVNGETNDVLSGSPEITSAATNAAVGSYPIVVAIGTLSAANYDFSFVNGTLTVQPAALVGTADNASRVYGDANPEFTVTYSGFVNGDDTNVLSGTLLASTTATTNSSVGNYPITASGQTAANYSVSYVDGTLTITPAVLSVVANDAGKIYGSTNPVFTGTLNGVRNADDITATYQSSATAGTGVGTYDITPVLNDPGVKLTNYNVFSTNGTLIISKATLTVTANDDTKVYGAANPTFTVDYSGFQNSDSTNVISGSPSFAVSPAVNGVGNYAIVPSAGTLSAVNYDFAFVNGTLSVTPASLTITANDATRPYGQANPQFTATYSGFVNGDDSNVLSGTLSFNTSATESSPVGEYAISVSGQSSTNYIISYVSGTLTVSKLTLTAAADDASRVYGATNPVFTGTVSANADSITATFASTATTNSPVGTYPIVPTFDDPNGKLTNYIVETSGTFTVTKAPLALLANDISRGYGSVNPAFTGNVVGVQNNENITATFSSSATTNSPVGVYAIHADLFATNNLDVADAAMLDNYLITTNGTLTITNASLVVDVDSTSRGYGASNPTFTGTINGIQNNENITALYSTVAVENSAIGTYPITATLSDNGSGVLSNYFVVVHDGTLTVAGGVITVTANSTNKVYGSANPEFTGNFSGAAIADGITVSYTTVANASSQVGDYDIIPVLDDHGSGALSNYVVNATSGTLTITKASLVISPEDKGVGAGTNTPALTVTLTGVQNSDFVPGDVTCRLNPARAKLATIANYSIIVSNIADSFSKLANYNVTTNVGMFRVVDNVKITAQPIVAPKSTVQQGTRVALTVKAVGIAATYQWRLNGNNIAGATSSALFINTTQFSDAGTYTVGITNAAGGLVSSGLLLTVLPDTNAPTVSIVRPANNSILLSSTNPTGSIVACGAAADTARVTNVFYRLNGSAWTPVAVFAPKDAAGLQAFWTNQLFAAVGTNTLETYSADWTGNTSKVTKAVFFFHVASPLSVSIDEHDTRAGEGSDSAWKPDYRGVKVAALVVPPNDTPTNGASLYVNRGPYSLNAIAGHNQIFSNWSVWVTGSATTNYVETAKYNFVMQTNLNLVANFIHNPWMEAQGYYYGLVTNGNVDFDISGGINLNVKTNQTFSGKVFVDGDPISISGVFKVNGTQTLTLSRAKLGKPNLVLSITNLFGTAGSSGTNQIVGTLTDTNSGKVASILADHAVYIGATSNVAQGTYTMVLPKASDSSVAPGGYGYATITVAADAKVTAVGSLADGTALVPQVGYISKDGRWPMFNQIYATKQIRYVNYTNNLQFHTNAPFLGMYLGWINLTNPSAGTLRWTKTVAEPTNVIAGALGVYSNYYPAGFSLDMPLTVKSYVNNGVGVRVINVTNGIVSFTDGNLPSSPQTHQMRYGNDAKVVLLSGTNIVKASTNAALGKLAVAFDSKLGKITGNFTNGISLLPTGAAKTITVAGVVLQPDNIAYGYFLGTNQSGAVTFQADETNP